MATERRIKRNTRESARNNNENTTQHEPAKQRTIQIESISNHKKEEYSASIHKPDTGAAGTEPHKETPAANKNEPEEQENVQTAGGTEQGSSIKEIQPESTELVENESAEFQRQSSESKESAEAAGGSAPAPDDKPIEHTTGEEKIQTPIDGNIRRKTRADGKYISVFFPEEVYRNILMEAEYYRKRGKKPHKDFLVVEQRVIESPFIPENSADTYKIHEIASESVTSCTEKKIWLPDSVIENLAAELKFNIDNDTILESRSQVIVNRIMNKKWQLYT